MPSTLHELLVMLLRATVGTFLVAVLPLAWRTMRWREANVMMPTPMGQERRVDLLLLDAAVPPRAGVVVEVQLRWDPRKQYTIPYYQSAARQQHECPVECIVVTPCARTAERFAASVDLESGVQWRPILIGPHEAWAWWNHHAANTLSHEVLALVTCIAGQLDDGRLARALFSSAIAMDSAPDAGYLEWAVTSLSETGGRVFTELTMNARATMHPRDFKNPLAVWWYGTGLEEGRDEGRDEGLKRGRVEGQVDLLLTLATPLCTSAELDALRKLPDLPTLRRAVQQRLGLPVTEPDVE